MVNFTPKKLSADEVEMLEAEYRSIESSPEQLEEIWKQMNSFFVVSDISVDADFRKDYFRWYTELSWRFLQTRDYDFVVNVAVARQIPTAVLLGFDVWKELMWYLFFKAELKADMESLYGRMREAFVKSEAVIGEWQGVEYKVSDLVDEVRSLERLGSDSIKEAEFRNKLLQIYTPDDDLDLQTYIAVDSVIAVNNLVGLVNFFLGVEVKKIWYIVDLYTHPDLSVLTEEENAPTPTVQATSLQPTPVLQPTTNPPQPVIKPAAPVKPTPAQIKSQIEKEFSVEDVEGIMNKLSELAEKNNDPKIAEMYYFDEKENKFKWNI